MAAACLERQRLLRSFAAFYPWLCESTASHILIVHVVGPNSARSGPVQLYAFYQPCNCPCRNRHSTCAMWQPLVLCWVQAPCPSGWCRGQGKYHSDRRGPSGTWVYLRLRAVLVCMGFGLVLIHVFMMFRPQCSVELLPGCSVAVNDRA